LTILQTHILGLGVKIFFVTFALIKLFDSMALKEVQDKSLKDILQALINWKSKILTAVAVITTCVAIYMFFQPNYYKSQTSFYAANPALGLPSPLGYADQTGYVFGSGVDLDRLFEIAESEEMIFHLVEKFDLMNVYEIDTALAASKSKILLAFRKNYTVTKSKKDALVLTIEDKDPERAAKIANYTRDRVALIAQDLIKNTHKQALENFTINIKDQTHIIDSTSNLLLVLKNKYELIQADFQAKVLTEQFIVSQADLSESQAKVKFYAKYPSKIDSLIKYQAATAGYSSKASTLNGKLDKFNTGVSELKRLEGELARAQDQLSIIKEKQKLLQIAFSNKFSAIHVIDQATVSDYKSRPMRSFVILLAALISTIVASFVVIVIEGNKTKSF
jgi:capsule polysaccharide export protein KpsE/RkpR